MSSLRLDWCSTEAATYACEHWHYSRTLPVNKTVRIGVWEEEKFIGAVIFSCGSSGVGMIGKRYGLKNTQVAELSRVALRSHRSPVTRIISIALRMLRRSQPGLRMIVSYADPEQGHIGAIYQGGNWIYVGRSSPDSAYIDKAGRRWHSRSVSNTGYKIHCGVKSPCPRPSQMVQQIIVPPKYKYFMPLDEEIRAVIAPLSKPYPKRVESDTNDTASVQDAEGGVTPTSTLQSLCQK
jgi:hypothetical protein